MAEVRLTPKAQSDLETIWMPIAAHNERAADRLIEVLWGLFELAATRPGFGPPRSELSPSARILVHGRYIAIYEPCEAGIDVIAVIHGAMDPGNWL